MFHLRGHRRIGNLTRGTFKINRNHFIIWLRSQAALRYSLCMTVIQMLGLPGSGKSTLARRLLDHLNWSRSFRIGAYHKRFPATEEGDRRAWEAMLKEMAQCEWRQMIFETAGMNPRWNEVMERCGRENVLTIKLECKLPELLRRISAKTPEDQAHGEWFPPGRFSNKVEFVKAVFDDFSRWGGDVVLDTTRAPAEEVFDLVARLISTRQEFSEEISRSAERPRSTRPPVAMADGAARE